jgi:hypothetical protein
MPSTAAVWRTPLASVVPNVQRAVSILRLATTAPSFAGVSRAGSSESSSTRSFARSAGVSAWSMPLPVSMIRGQA